MAHTYTPGLRVARRTRLRKARLLPIPGEVLVRVGDRVRPETIVARTELPGRVHPVNVVNLLGIAPADIRSYMVKVEGEGVAAEEVIAETRPLLKWFKTEVRAPADGFVESISTVTGQVLIRERPLPLELRAYVAGEVVEVIPEGGAVVETTGSLVQGIFGVGGETTGPLAMAVESPGESLGPDRIRPEHRGAVVVGGSLVPAEALRRAQEVGVQAVVVGGVHDRDLRELLGYDLGVAITGSEAIGFTLILTEGFGPIAMAERTFDLLGRHQGAQASVSGATQIRAGVIRPEVIIPLAPAGRGPGGEVRDEVPGGLQVGETIRIIREPYFGLLARVRSLPPDLQTISTESRVRVLEAELPDGRVLTIPRANVERLEA